MRESKLAVFTELRYAYVMKRREILLFGTAAAVAQSLFTATGCKAKGGTTAAAAATASSESAAFAAELSGCVQAGETCLSHCLRLLAGGDTSMGACAKSVREMLAVCGAVQTLALSDSRHLASAAALCANVCEDCRVECAKHASHHAECKACEEACERTIAAAKAVASA